MKKRILLISLIVISLTTFAQEKNGTVFIKHSAIEKTNSLWDAFVKGDKEAYGALLADTIAELSNGKLEVTTREKHVAQLDWWKNEFSNLSVVDHKPAFPDAIEYDEGGTWVQDWKLVTGTHNASGINIKVPLHNLYSFNDDGKITSIHHYYNNDVFEEIRNSAAVKENGTIYINHPYIASVRKLVNAYCAKDIEKMTEFYSPKATFSSITTDYKKSNDLTTQMDHWKKRFEEVDKFTMDQIGYPDCLHYEKGNIFVVQSWWNYSVKVGDKVHTAPMMLALTFDKEGKIVESSVYISTNHFED